MRTIKFVMMAEIDIDDDTFTQSMTDIDKVRFDVVRGYTTLRIKDMNILNPDTKGNCKPVPAEPIIHICKKKDYYDVWRSND